MKSTTGQLWLKHVKGHSNQRWNDWADRLANQGRHGSHATRRARYNHLRPRRLNRAYRLYRRYRHRHRHRRHRHRHRRPSHQREHDQTEPTKLPNPTGSCAPPTALEPSPSRSQSISNMHSPLNVSTRMRTLSLLGSLLTLSGAPARTGSDPPSARRTDAPPQPNTPTEPCGPSHQSGSPARYATSRLSDQC